MTATEAEVLLGLAKHSMPFIEAGIAEDFELKLYRGLSAEQAHQLADSVLPRVGVAASGLFYIHLHLRGRSSQRFFVLSRRRRHE